MLLLENVRKSYNSNVALDGLNLNVNQGDIYALLGPNGAGKTTTINLLLGFISADSGTISVAGLNPADDQKKVRKSIAYLPENVNLYPYLSGVENLDYFCKLGGVSYFEKELTEILSHCGLAEKSQKQRLSTYSKGMRQKVGIAIAYAKKAAILLLDEPASGLDPAASNEFSQLLRDLSSGGMTVLMASHDIFRVRETANRIGILNHGKLVEELQADAISANDLESIYLNYMKE